AYAVWFSAGQKMLNGGDISGRDRDGDFRFMYPPPAAALLALPAALGAGPLTVILVLINSAAWLVCVLLAVYLTTGKILRQDALLYWAPSCCCLSYLYDCYLLGQPAIVLLACLLGAMACLR